jgi:hypothetical protein
MTAFGFSCLEGANYSVYKHTSPTGRSIVIVHTDDMAVTSSTSAEIQRIITDLSSTFEIIDLGKLKWLLGIAISRDCPVHTISLCQSAYIEKITHRFNLEHATPAYIPMDPHVDLTATQSPSSDAASLSMARVPYRTLIGSIMYAAICSRPDISYAVGKLSCHSVNPGEAHWTTAKHTLHYLYMTRTLHLTLSSPHATITLSGKSDSEFATDPDNRISVSGYCFSLGSGIVSWSSCKQSCVTLLSCEAEYVTMCNATREAIWLRTLLSLLDFPQSQPSLICIDNQGTLDILYNPTSHTCMKHLDLPLLFACHCATIDNSLTYQWISTHDMLADIFTKPLPCPAHTKLTCLLGLS